MLLAVVTASMASAQDVNILDGREVYRTYCWQCHGQDATGNGPMAEMLAIETPDLTKLSARHDGTFPTEAVSRQIDGRAPLLAHGGEMPIFGPFFETDQKVALPLTSGQPLMTSLLLANLVVYLESIQAE
jgi:mono/diheme cytochrome c family protein